MSNWIWKTLARLLAGAVFTVGAALGDESRDDERHVRAFARVPKFSLAALSPNGKLLSYVDHANDRQTLVLRDLRSGREKHALSFESRREAIRWCDWVSVTHVICGSIVGIRRPEGVSQATRLYAIDVSSGAVRQLNRRLRDPIRDRVIGLIPSKPNRVLVQHDPVGFGYPEVAELDVETGHVQRATGSHPPVRRWMSDTAGRVALGIGYEGDSATLHIRRGQSDEWSLWLTQSLSDPSAVGPLVIGASDELFALRLHRGRAALFKLELAAREPSAKLVFADAEYDVSGPVILDPVTGTLLSIQYVREHELQQPLQHAEERRLEWIDAQLPGVANLIVDRSEDGRWLLVRSLSDTDAPTLYLMDSAEPSLKLIGHAYPELEGRVLAPMQSVSYRARDGQGIPAYLTTPIGPRREGSPAVVLPHGGPETRDWQTFDPLVQFLAAEGYVVLQMNFRGSFGYGLGFAAAGAQQWGGVIHNDITDGTRWLIEQNIADPTRICIVGSSFGGYAALLGAARESEWYSCAVSFAGVADLLAFSQHTVRLSDADVWKQRLGEDTRALWQMSPMGRIHAVETPVLLVHGRNDATVPFSQSRRFARALRQAGKEHRFVERADCDHEMNVESCRLTFYSELTAFLAEHIKR